MKMKNARKLTKIQIQTDENSEEERGRESEFEYVWKRMWTKAEEREMNEHNTHTHCVDKVQNDKLVYFHISLNFNIVIWKLVNF